MEVRWQMANENHMITFKTGNRSSVEYLLGLRWISHINQKQFALLLFLGVRINEFDVHAENCVIGRNLIILVLDDVLCSLKSAPLIIPHTQIDHIKCFVDWVGFEAVEIVHRSLSSICRVQFRIFSEEVMHCSTHCVLELEETNVEGEVLLFVWIHRIQLVIQIPDESRCQSNSIIAMCIFEIIISGQVCLLLSFGVMMAEHGMRFAWLPLSTCHHADVFTLQNLLDERWTLNIIEELFLRSSFVYNCCELVFHIFTLSSNYLYSSTIWVELKSTLRFSYCLICLPVQNLHLLWILRAQPDGNFNTWVFHIFIFYILFLFIFIFKVI